MSNSQITSELAQSPTAFVLQSPNCEIDAFKAAEMVSAREKEENEHSNYY